MTDTRHLHVREDVASALSLAPYERLRSLHAAQLTVDVLQDLGVGLVFGSMATQGALRKSAEVSRVAVSALSRPSRVTLP